MEPHCKVTHMSWFSPPRSWSFTSEPDAGSTGSASVLPSRSVDDTATPPSTSSSPTDFVYVDYNDYEEYSASGEPWTPGEMPVIPTTVTTTSTAATATTRRLRKTAPPYLFRRKTTTPTMPVVTVAMVTTNGQNAASSPFRTSGVPEFPTTLATTTWADADDLITEGPSATPLPSPKGTTGGRRRKPKTDPRGATPTPATPSSSSSSFPFSREEKKENNSVDEVPYRIVGLDGEFSRTGHQNYFVPRMPPFRERTQNKRIQELLNEKRRQELLQRPGRTKDPLPKARRTVRKHTGL